MREALKGKWSEFWPSLGASGDGMPVFDDLCTRWSEPARHYHTLQHLAHCLAEWNGVRELAEDPVAVEAALWFHDAVYDPRAKDNEEHSARLAAATLKSAHVGGAFIDKVSALILDTKHNAPPSSADGTLLVDVDLAILGQPADVFEDYELRIRKEYAWVPEADFVAGRSSVLRNFLARPAIYGTAVFRDRYEERARENLERSLAKLVS